MRGHGTFYSLFRATLYSLCPPRTTITELPLRGYAGGGAVCAGEMQQLTMEDSGVGASEIVATVVRCFKDSGGEVRRFLGICSFTGAVNRDRGLLPSSRRLLRVSTVIRSVNVGIDRRGCGSSTKGCRRLRNPRRTRGLLTTLNCRGAFVSGIYCLIKRRRACKGVSALPCQVLMRTSFLIGLCRSSSDHDTTRRTCSGVFHAGAKGGLLGVVFLVPWGYARLP